MKLDERLKLLQWAKKQNVIIIEDEYDSEFQRKGRPIEPLKVLDFEDRVVYLGTFAKYILPALRIGFAILPPELIYIFLKARNLYGEYTTSVIEQMAAAIFIKTGKLERHLKRMRWAYSQKYQVFQESIFEYNLEGFDLVDTSTGLHQSGTWKYSKEEYLLFEEECEKHGVSCQSADFYFSALPPKPTIIFGLSHLSEEEIKLGLKTMGEVFKTLNIGKN